MHFLKMKMYLPAGFMYVPDKNMHFSIRNMHIIFNNKHVKTLFKLIPFPVKHKRVGLSLKFAFLNEKMMLKNG